MNTHSNDSHNNSGIAHGLAGHVHDAMCSGRDDNDVQLDSHTLGRPINTGSHTGAGHTTSTTTAAGAGHVLPGGAGLGHGSHGNNLGSNQGDHHSHGSPAVPLAGAAGVGATAVGAHHDHGDHHSKLGHNDHKGLDSGSNTFGRSGAGEGVPSTKAHNSVERDTSEHKKGIFSAFDMTKDHTSTPAMVHGTTYGKHDVAAEDGVNLPDLPKDQRKNLASHEPGLAAEGHTFAPAGKTGVDSQKTSHAGVHNAHPEAGLATAGSHGAGHDTRSDAPGHIGSRGATGAGIAGGERDLARSHETHNVHDSNAHRTTGEPEHKEGIIDKLKHAIGK